MYVAACFCLVSPHDSQQEEHAKRVPNGHGQSLGSWPWQQTNKVHRPVGNHKKRIFFMECHRGPPIENFTCNIWGFHYNVLHATSSKRKVNILAQANFLTENCAQRNWHKLPKKKCKIFENLVKLWHFFLNAIFYCPIFLSKVNILQRFLKILDRRGYALLQLLEALQEDGNHYPWYHTHQCHELLQIDIKKWILWPLDMGIFLLNVSRIGSWGKSNFD